MHPPPRPPDIEIAEAATIIPIVELARDRLGIDAADLVPYGHTKAKVSLAHLRTLTDHPDGNLVLVTAMSPTPAGEGKTTTSVGLADGLSLIGEKAMVARASRRWVRSSASGRGGWRRVRAGRADGRHQPQLHR